MNMHKVIATAESSLYKNKSFFQNGFSRMFGNSIKARAII